MNNLPWKNEKEFYDLHAKRIFSKYNFYHSSKIGKTDIDFLSYIIKKAYLLPSQNILDLGCGSGYLVSKLNEFGCNAIGISTSEEVIKEARNRFKNNKFIVGNMETFQFKDMDRVLALESLCY